MQINQFKNYIKNLVAGNNLSKEDFLEMYKEVLREQIVKRVEKIFIAHNLEETIEKFIRHEVKSIIVKLIEDPSKEWWKQRKDLEIEKLIKAEIEKQVVVQMNEMFKITLNGKEVLKKEEK